MTRFPRTVGVIGGMGPDATIHLMRRVLDSVQAADDSDHVPLLVDSNTQVPSRIKALIERDGADPAPVLARMAQRLEAAGAEALVMPCNTAHHYAARICESVSIPFISMVEETCDAIAARYPGAKVGVLASPAVTMTGVYNAPLARRGLEAVAPRDEDALLAAIRALKRSARDVGAIDALGWAARDVSGRGARVALVCCSEFSIVSGKIAAPIPIVDSIDVLVEAIIAFSHGADMIRDTGHIGA